MAAAAYSDLVDFSFSVVLMGDAAVGKSLLVACTQPSMSTDSIPSPGSQFGAQCKVRTYSSKGAVYRVHMWEVPGAPRYVESASRYAALAAGIILVFDVNRRLTFERVATWLSAADSVSGDVPIILVGNKADEPPGAMRVSSGEAEEFAAQHGMQYFETSALGNRGVSEAFSVLMAIIINQIPNPPEPSFIVKRRIQIGRKLADNTTFRAALFDVPMSPGA